MTFSQQEIFKISNEDEFADLSLRIFRYQAESNPVYREYMQHLKIVPSAIESITEIPFLPIEFFRKHMVISGHKEPVIIFESSGTTGMNTSRHYIADTDLYTESFLNSFRLFFGEPSEYFFAALLPSYIDRGNSSLVYMVNRLIKESRDVRSGFFINDSIRLLKTLEEVKGDNIKSILIGVSFALLDLAEEFKPNLDGIMVVETGGMKGKRKEITREELHSELKKGLNINTVYSEYGMTELLSQSWSRGNGLFTSPPWMRVLVRDSYDPLTVFNEPGRSGGINVIDLANINSCSFISTGDLGKVHNDGTFEVLGRFDNSDIRGCNLLIE